MNQPSEYQVAVDLGSSVVTTVVGSADDYGQLHVYGVGRAPSNGITNGQVTNVSRTAASIRQSLDQAEASSGRAITQVGFCVTGTHFASVNNRGAVALPSAEEPITWDDMLRAEESGKAVTIRPGTELVHAIPRYFIVDADRRCDDPRGQHGRRLDVETHIVTGSTSAIQNAAACVAKAGVQISLVAAKPVVGAVRAIHDDDRQLGALVLGLDAGTTSINAFEDGAISHTSVIGIGTLDIAHDLAYGLGCSVDHALRLMRAHGMAHPLLVPRAAEPIQLPGFADGVQQVTLTKIAEFIYPRLSEIITMVQDQVTEHQLQYAATCGIVVTGVGATLQGVERVIERAFETQGARVGSVGPLSGLSDQLSGPDAIAAVGMLEWLVQGAAQSAAAARQSRRNEPAQPSLIGSLAAGVSSIARVFSPHA